jgi:CRP-like cAMP-binding protein
MTLRKTYRGEGEHDTGLVDDLQKFALFKDVALPDLKALARLVQIKHYADGAVVFEKGQLGDAMFLIRAGRIRIYIRDAQDNEITFRYYGPGHVAGEFSVFDEKPRSASGAAEGALEVMILGREDLLAFIRARPLVGVSAMRSLAERIRYTTDYLQKITQAVDLLARQEYEQALGELVIAEAGENPEDIENLISAFVQMVASIRSRDAGQFKTSPPA